MNHAALFAACVSFALCTVACTSSSPGPDVALGDATRPIDAGTAQDGGTAIDARVLLDAASSACSPITTTDALRIDQAKRSPDGQGWCCVPEWPTCGCGYFGGFVRDRCSCGETAPKGSDKTPFGYCDLAPPDWILGTDEHGCSAYRAQSPATGCCGNCGGQPDAGR